MQDEVNAQNIQDTAEDEIPPLLHFDQVNNTYVLPYLITNTFLLPVENLHYTYSIQEYVDYSLIQSLEKKKIRDYCLFLLDEAMQQEGVDFCYEESIYDGISGEDIVKGNSVFVINDSWNFPLHYSTLETMFKDFKLENPHYKEPIKRILKLNVI